MNIIIYYRIIHIWYLSVFQVKNLRVKISEKTSPYFHWKRKLKWLKSPSWTKTCWETYSYNRRHQKLHAGLQLKIMSDCTSISKYVENTIIFMVSSGSESTAALILQAVLLFDIHRFFHVFHKKSHAPSPRYIPK